MSAGHVPPDQNVGRDATVAWLRDELATDFAAIDKLDSFAALLREETAAQNLIAANTVPVLWARHILDSAQLLAHVPRETSGDWLDLGTGAGFPGIIVAILAERFHLSLVEQRPLRHEWLTRAVSQLGLNNANVIGTSLAKVETHHFQVISARAFAPMVKLLRDAERFAGPETLWLLPKGRSAQEELETVSSWQNTFHVERSVTDGDSGIIVGTLNPRKSGRRQ